MSIHLSITAETPAELHNTLVVLLAGTAAVALTNGNRTTKPLPSPAPALAADTAEEPEADEALADAADAGEVGTDEIDAHGHPWNAEIHAGTKGKTKDGLWRLKVGATRPEPVAGFPKPAAGAAAASGAAPSESAGAAGSENASDAAAASQDEEDEFAAFKAADAATGGEAGAVTARTWTDADLSKLCNQAATKLGTPEPVKAIIAKHVPEGEVPHSRNIPADSREAFAVEVEQAAGITFAGG